MGFNGQFEARTLCCAAQQNKPADFCWGSFSSDRPASDALGMSASLRSRPNLRTAANRRGVPRTDLSNCSKKTLFDHSASLGEQHRRQLDAEGLGSFQVDCKVELHWRLYRQVGRLRTLEDTINIGCRAVVL